jgi:hypothetical protein
MGDMSSPETGAVKESGIKTGINKGEHTFKVVIPK